MKEPKIFSDIEFNNKVEEEKIIKGVLDRLSLDYKTLTSREKPDYEINFNSGLIGVEITKFYSDENKKGSKSYKNLVELKKSYEKQNQMAYYDALHLQEGYYDINYSKVEQIIKKKEILSKNYSQNFYQKWLIIYSGGLMLSDICLFNDDIKKNKTIVRQGKALFVKLDDNEEIVNNEKKIETLTYFDFVFIFDKFSEIIWQTYPKICKVFDYGEKKLFINRLPLSDIKNES